MERLPSHVSLPFRPEIEGLRAVAVLAVLAFHLGLAIFPGGFRGVDVFFVISGYLITSLIVPSIANKTFSITEFYRRRILRIVPAVTVTMALTIAWAFLDGLPGEARGIAMHAASAAFFVSNIYFAVNLPYFGPATELMPLLHTWSLGVEEQFYLLYPALLLLIARLAGGAMRRAILLVTALSFGLLLASYAIQIWIPVEVPLTDGPSRFYLLPFRAWQIGAGALVALGVTSNRSPLLAALGLVAMIASFLVAQGDSRDVLMGVIAVLGAAAFIANAQSGVAGRLLSLAPFRVIGRASYSIYLVHVPIIAIYRIHTGVRLDGLEMLVLAVIVLIAGFASYRFIERPFLTRFREAPPRLVFRGMAAAVFLIGSASVALVVYSRSDHAVSGPVRGTLESFGPSFRAEHRQQNRCLLRENKRVVFAVDNPCFAFAADRPNLLLIGDSRAAQFADALAARAPSLRIPVMTAGGCVPTPGQVPIVCRRLRDYVLGEVARNRQLSGVVISGFWHEELIDGLQKTIDTFARRGIPVTVLGPHLSFQAPLPVVIARLQRDGRSISDYERFIDPEPFALNREMKRRLKRARYIDLLAIQCPDGRCQVRLPDGTLMHPDMNHYTPAGAQWMMRDLDPAAWITPVAEL